MAVAAPADSRKSVFRRALSALRYAVAAAVTVILVVTAVYAFHVVARPDDLIIDVVDGYISVHPPPPPQPHPKLSFTLRVVNPGGRIRFYYTGIRCVLSLNDSHIGNSTFFIPDIVVAPDAVMPFDTEADFNSITSVPNDILGGNLTLTGDLTVGVYSAYNKTTVRTTYYCTSLTVGKYNNGSYSGWWSYCSTTGTGDTFGVGEAS